MLQPLSPQPNTPLLKQVARFAERRQEVLAGNVANIDTPGYRMRELPVSEFRQALQRAVSQMQSRPGSFVMAESGLSSPGLTNSTPASLEELFPESLFQARTPEEQPGITFQDANNRSIEHQFLEMTKNTLWQNFALELLRGQYDQLQSVIAEQP